MRSRLRSRVCASVQHQERSCRLQPAHYVHVIWVSASISGTPCLYPMPSFYIPEGL